jgi:hypothetical protein
MIFKLPPTAALVIEVSSASADQHDRVIPQNNHLDENWHTNASHGSPSEETKTSDSDHTSSENARHTNHHYYAYSVIRATINDKIPVKRLDDASLDDVPPMILFEMPILF